METFAILVGIAVALGAMSNSTPKPPVKGKLVYFKGTYTVKKPIYHKTWWVDKDGTRYPGGTWEQ